MLRDPIFSGKNVEAVVIGDHFCRLGINKVWLLILLNSGQLNGKPIFRCPRLCLKVWFRKTGSAVPYRVSLLILHSQIESGAYSQILLIHPVFHDGVHQYCQQPSGQSRIHQAAQLRTDGVHRRESAGTEAAIVLYVARVTGAANFRQPRGAIDVRSSFPTPTVETVFRGHVL